MGHAEVDQARRQTLVVVVLLEPGLEFMEEHDHVALAGMVVKLLLHDFAQQVEGRDLDMVDLAPREEPEPPCDYR